LFVTMGDDYEGMISELVTGGIAEGAWPAIALHLFYAFVPWPLAMTLIGVAIGWWFACHLTYHAAVLTYKIAIS